MKKILITLLFTPILFMAMAQDPFYKAPDYKAIKKIMKDKHSENYYPRLLERYLNSDTSLTIENCKILYYGTFFTDSYSPYPQNPYSDSISSILNKDTLVQNDFEALIKYENLVLKECPFNMRDLNILSYSYSQLGDTISANRGYFKLDLIIRTIMSTGDGKEEKSAWHVISISHEYDLLRAMGFRFGGKQSLTKGGCDYLEVQENEYNMDGFYFDVNMILSKEQELFKK
jgi:hypothetical protein